MGWVVMSERELGPIEALSRVVEGRMSVAHAAGVPALCDRVAVLRDGRDACESRRLAGMTRADLVRLMIGGEERAGGLRARPAPAGTPALELDAVSTSLGHRDVSPRVHAGGIVGPYGLVGAGRAGLARAAIGQARVTADALRVGGEVARIGGVGGARDRWRVGCVSEDRKGEGLILLHPALDNAGVTVWGRLASRLGPLGGGGSRRRRPRRPAGSKSGRPGSTGCWPTSRAATNRRCRWPSGSPPGPAR